jgi:AAA domain
MAKLVGMSGVRSFFTELGVVLPGAATSGDISVRCFANPVAHTNDDRSPSCRVNLDTGQWSCHGCGASGGAFDAGLAQGRSHSEAAALAKRHGLFAEDRITAVVEQAAPRSPSEGEVAGWASRLCGSDAVCERLWESRRWTLGALEALDVGVDGRALTLPLRSPDGALAGVLRLTGSEMRPLAMRGCPRMLWPAPESIPAGERVYIVEGEKDAISMRSVGLAAVGVPGANNWRSEWCQRFAGRNVTVIGDCDAAGRRLVSRIVNDLAAHAAAVRVLDLDATRSDGFDVGDLIGDAKSRDDLAQVRELLERMIEAANLDGTVAKPTPTSLNGAGPAASTSAAEPIGGGGAACAGKVSAERRVTFTQASTVEPEIVRWAWQDRVPLGALTIIAGQPGLGKSTATIYIGAQISRGTLEGSLYGQPASVLYVTLEDHLASVVRPRLEAAGADLESVQLIGVKVDEHDGLITLPGDLEEIEEGARRLGARLLVVDPIVATLDGSVDSHRDQSVRRALAPLAQFAERMDLAVLGVMHMSKAQGTELLNRVAGSVAFGGAPRSVFAFARDPEDPDGELGYDRVLVHAKANWGRYAPSLRCRINTGAVDTRNGPSEQSVLTIIGECDTTGADLTSNREPGELEEAIEFLEEHLSNGEWHARKEIKAASDARRLAWRTVERAKQRLEVEHARAAHFGSGTRWRLPVAPEHLRQGWRDCEWRDRGNGSVEPDTGAGTSSPASLAGDGATEGIKPPDTIAATPDEEALLRRLSGERDEPEGVRQ